MNRFTFFWAVRKILRRSRLTGCMVLICLVTAPLVLALVFSSSMMAGITNKYIYLSNGHILVHGLSNIEPDKTNIIYVDTVISGSALAYSSDSTASFVIKGITNSYFNEQRQKQLTFITEENINQSNLSGITLSRKTAENLNVKIGDRIALMIVPDSSNSVVAPKIVRVNSLFYSGYDQLDENLAFVSYDYARTLFPSEESISTEILLSNSLMDKTNVITSNFNDNIKYSTWDQNNISVYQNFVTSRQMIIIILLLISCVAAYYSANIAQQMIQDDMVEIATVKLIGGSNKLIVASSFISVFTVTLLGVIIGFFLGLFISFNIGPFLSHLAESGISAFSYYLLDFDITIPYSDIFLVLSSLLIISVISIFISLRKTKRISPIQLFTSL